MTAPLWTLLASFQLIPLCVLCLYPACPQVGLPQASTSPLSVNHTPPAFSLWNLEHMRTPGKCNGSFYTLRHFPGVPTKLKEALGLFA